MAHYKIQPPDLEECKSFDVYLTKLKVWEATTPAPEETRGAIIASSLPNNSKKFKKDLQDKFYEQVDGDKLVTKEGVELVKTFLKKELGEEDLYKMVRVWNELENCQRSVKTIDEFIDSFERCYTSVTSISKTTNIPAEIRAFMVLKRANVSDTQRMLVLSKIDLNDKAGMFDKMCKELKLVLGGGPGKPIKDDNNSNDGIRVEPIKDEEGVFVTFNGEKYYRGSGHQRGRGRGYGGRGGGHWHGGRDGKPYERPQPRENRKDDKGEVTRCRFCDSKFHYRQQCMEYTKFLKDGGTNKVDENPEVHCVMEEVDFALATQLQEELSQFTWEAKNCAALDTCCTSSVSGKPWFDMYLQELCEDDKAKVKGPFETHRVFKFGNNGKLRSMGQYSIPVIIAGRSFEIEFLISLC